MPVLPGVTFAVTVKETVPFPVPDILALLTVIHESLETAVQPHAVLLVVTVKLPLPPTFGKFVEVGESVIVQPLA